jgi:hypothetical protein
MGDKIVYGPGTLYIVSLIRHDEPEILFSIEENNKYHRFYDSSANYDKCWESMASTIHISERKSTSDAYEYVDAFDVVIWNPLSGIVAATAGYACHSLR